MKKIDQLLARSFILPFIATFFIALFVLIMQFLWVYIDDIIGKGASFWMILELLSYLTMSLIPTALPIAVLISSVMVMGNLAEFYELASFKSAGVSLIRVMVPLMWIVGAISIFSYFCSNNIIPVANLQFKSRLYDIRKQKPTMSLEAGVFNEDFQDFVIHIGKKGSNNRDIEDVLIYDHKGNNRKPMQILAKRGEMYTTKDNRYFIMNLYEGNQYQETEQFSRGSNQNFPFIRTSFKEWTKVFDLSEFEISRTEADLFGSHHTMLTTSQLSTAIDSLDLKMEKSLKRLDKGANRYFWIFKNETPEDNIELDSLKVEKVQKKIMSESIRLSEEDSLDQIMDNEEDSIGQENTETEDSTSLTFDDKEDTIALKTTIKVDTTIKVNPIENTLSYKQHKKATTKSTKKPLIQEITKPLSEYHSIAELFPNKKFGRGLYTKAQSYARNMQGVAMSGSRDMEKLNESKVKHIYELHIKFSMAAVCFVFLFIGAPMGAIVRKGGFGYPILIAIVFFMIFIILNIFCKKLAETYVISAQLSSWLPCLILFPVGVILTYRAMNDSKLVNTERYQRIFTKLIHFFKPKS